MLRWRIPFNWGICASWWWFGVGGGQLMGPFLIPFISLWSSLMYFLLHLWGRSFPSTCDEGMVQIPAITCLPQYEFEEMMNHHWWCERIRRSEHEEICSQIASVSDFVVQITIQIHRQRDERVRGDDDTRADLGLWNAPITLHSSDRAGRKKADWDLKYWCPEEVDGGIGQTNKRDSICNGSLSNLNSRSKSGLTAVWELYLKECLLRGVCGPLGLSGCPVSISLPSKVLMCQSERGHWLTRGGCGRKRLPISHLGIVWGAIEPCLQAPGEETCLHEHVPHGEMPFRKHALLPNWLIQLCFPLSQTVHTSNWKVGVEIFPGLQKSCRLLVLVLASLVSGRAPKICTDQKGDCTFLVRWLIA